jgi:hypothetical protein
MVAHEEVLEVYCVAFSHTGFEQMDGMLCVLVEDIEVRDARANEEWPSHRTVEPMRGCMTVRSHESSH